MCVCVFVGVCWLSMWVRLYSYHCTDDCVCLTVDGFACGACTFFFVVTS